MKIPRAKFTVGDPVRVRIVEAGEPPTFDATVSGVSFKRGSTEYTVTEESGAVSDGYTEGWLERRTLPREIPTPREVIRKAGPYSAEDLVDAVLACAEEELQGRLSGLENGFDHPNAQVLFGRAKGIALELRGMIRGSSEDPRITESGLRSLEEACTIVFGGVSAISPGLYGAAVMRVAAMTGRENTQEFRDEVFSIVKELPCSMD